MFKVTVQIECFLWEARGNKFVAQYMIRAKDYDVDMARNWGDLFNLTRCQFWYKNQLNGMIKILHKLGE